MAAHPRSLPHSPLDLGGLQGLQSLEDPRNTQEQNHSPDCLTGGDLGMGQGTGHRAEAGGVVGGPFKLA